MDTLYDFTNFYGIYQNTPDATPESIASFLFCTETQATKLICQAGIIEKVLEILKTYPEADWSFFLEKSSLPAKQLSFYIAAIEILFPNQITISCLAGSPRWHTLKELKLKSALDAYIDAQVEDETIAEKLNISIDAVKVAKENLPAIKEEHQLVELLRLEEDIREFFQLYPNTTIPTAAKRLKVSARQLRSTIEEMRSKGETIQYSNVPAAFEREEIRKKVMELKKSDPALTNVEVGLKLGVSTGEVTRAIKDALQVWQREKADSYEFYFHKTLEELDDIKEKAWTRHDGSEKSSSRWMELILMATEKQIGMLGLKAPERLDIRQEIRTTKEERDALVKAALATDAIDAEFGPVEVTGIENE